MTGNAREYGLHTRPARVYILHLTFFQAPITLRKHETNHGVVERASVPLDSRGSPDGWQSWNETRGNACMRRCVRDEYKYPCMVRYDSGTRCALRGAGLSTGRRLTLPGPRAVPHSVSASADRHTQRPTMQREAKVDGGMILMLMSATMVVDTAQLA